MHEPAICPSHALMDLPTSVEIGSAATAGSGSRATLIFFQVERPEREVEALGDLATKVRVAGEGSGGERATLVFFGVEG